MKNAQMTAWINRNLESLRADYHAYALHHDYDPNGIPLSFDAYCAAAWRNELEMRQFWADREMSTR